MTFLFKVNRTVTFFLLLPCKESQLVQKISSLSLSLTNLQSRQCVHRIDHLHIRTYHKWRYFWRLFFHHRSVIIKRKWNDVVFFRYYFSRSFSRQVIMSYCEQHGKLTKFSLEFPSQLIMLPFLLVQSKINIFYLRISFLIQRFVCL